MLAFQLCWPGIGSPGVRSFLAAVPRSRVLKYAWGHAVGRNWCWVQGSDAWWADGRPLPASSVAARTLPNADAAGKGGPPSPRRIPMRERYGSVGLALFGLCLALMPARSAPAADLTYKAVAFLDTTAPGGGKLVNDFEPGSVSGQGEVAFVVDYQPPDSTAEGLYLASAGSLIPIVEPGKTAVDDWIFTSEGEIDAIVSPVGMNGNGDVSFGCDIQKKGETDVKTGTFL